VGSLFSHLPREDFGPFLAALYGALEPDGLLLFSTHTPHVLPAEKRDASGFTFLAESESRILDTRLYGSSFVAPEVVRALASEVGIERTWSCGQDLWRIQDVHAAGPRADLSAWKHTPLVRGSIEGLAANGELLRIGGWARVPREYEKLERIELVVDGKRTVPTSAIDDIDELPPEAGGSFFRQTNWYVEGSVRELGPGFHTICAVGTAGETVRSCFDARGVHVD